MSATTPTTPRPVASHQTPMSHVSTAAAAITRRNTPPVTSSTTTSLGETLRQSDSGSSSRSTYAPRLPRLRPHSDGLLARLVVIFFPGWNRAHVLSDEPCRQQQPGTDDRGDGQPNRAYPGHNRACEEVDRDSGA